MSPALTEGRRLSLTTPDWELILLFTTNSVRSGHIKLPRQVRLRSCLPGAKLQSGRGSPWVTTIDGTNNTIVWVVGTGTGGDQRLHGYDGDSGAVIYAGGGNNELMTGTRQWNTGIAARGRIYFAADNKVYAFTPSTGTPTPTPTALQQLLLLLQPGQRLQPGPL